MSNGMVRSGVPDPNSSDVHASRLIEQYTPLIYRVIRSFGFWDDDASHEGMEPADAFQVGCLALWQASLEFDQNQIDRKFKHPFLIYAQTRIRQEIGTEMRRYRWFGRRHTRMIEGWSFQDFEEQGREDYESDDIVANAESMELAEKIDESIARMDAKRRNIYQSVMRHDGVGKNGEGKRYCERENISQTWLSVMRSDIRDKLKEALH